MNPNALNKIILLIGAMLMVAQAAALSTDSDQPIEIEADYAELDDTRHITTYTGNVVATQGSIRLTGDKMVIHYSEDNELQLLQLFGKPATFRQRPDGADIDNEGEALTLEYHAPEEFVYLIENAKLNQGEKVFTGHRMEYDTQRSILKGYGAPKGTQASDGSGRVKLIIPPVKKKPE